MEHKRYISTYDINLSFSMFKYVNSATKDSTKIWDKDFKVELNYVYKVLNEKNNCLGVFMDFEGINETKLKRIGQKMNIIEHEFFMYCKDDRVRIGWHNGSKIVIK